MLQQLLDLQLDWCYRCHRALMSNRPGRQVQRPSANLELLVRPSASWLLGGIDVATGHTLPKLTFQAVIQAEKHVLMV